MRAWEKKNWSDHRHHHFLPLKVIRIYQIDDENEIRRENVKRTVAGRAGREGEIFPTQQKINRHDSRVFKFLARRRNPASLFFSAFYLYNGLPFLWLSQRLEKLVFNRKHQHIYYIRHNHVTTWVYREIKLIWSPKYEPTDIGKEKLEFNSLFSLHCVILVSWTKRTWITNIECWILLSRKITKVSEKINIQSGAK